MTRTEILRIVVARARTNGFKFREWFQTHIRSEWPGGEQAFDLLTTDGRYYALLFSMEFATAFWKTGAQMAFVVPTQHYTRRNSKGEIITVERKAFTRRTVKADVWKYHLREMAVSPDPVEYIRRFIPVEEDIRRRKKVPERPKDRILLSTRRKPPLRDGA